MKEAFIDTLGYRTRYLEAGKGQPIVLLHGSGPGVDTKTNWEGVINAFSDRYRMIGYDMVGFGFSDRPDPANFTYSQQGRVDQLIAFCEALNLKTPWLFGNSLGGFVALGACVARQDMFEKVIVMGAGARASDATDNVRRGYTFLPDREQMRSVLNTLMRSGLEVDEATLDYRYKISRNPENQAAHLAIGRWILNEIDTNGHFGYTEAEIASITQKILVIHGWEDQAVPVNKGIELARELKNGWLHVIPNCGHWTMLEHPTEFNETVGLFLKNA